MEEHRERREIHGRSQNKESSMRGGGYEGGSCLIFYMKPEVNFKI